MKYDQMKLEIQKKEDKLRAKQEYTLELFNLVKDDCVDIVTQKQIECNFEYETMLCSHDIVGAIGNKKGIDIRSADIYIQGVQNAWISSQSAWTRSDMCIEWRELIDAPLLMTSLRSYIISKGFEGKSYTHRYTGKRCDVMEFQTTKHKLLNQPPIHTSDEQSTMYTFVGIVCALLIFGIIYLAS